VYKLLITTRTLQILVVAIFASAMFFFSLAVSRAENQHGWVIVSPLDGQFEQADRQPKMMG
jgi:hypothetical protein